MYKNHLLSVTDLSSQEIWEVLTLAKKLKSELRQTNKVTDVLKNKSLVMLFEKPSLRTKLSFDIGMTKLGGNAIYFSPAEVGLGVRETTSDVSKVVSSMGDILMARTFKHETVEELARNSTIPVINGLSDLEHPCQTLADLLTIWEQKGKIKDLKIAYVGDGENNVTHSLCLGAALMGADFACASPTGYWMKPSIVKKAKEISIETHGEIFETADPKEALFEADIVYTDTWISMGDESEKQERIKGFLPYQVTENLMKYAKKDALFMHDLPAYRGKEVAAEVIDGAQSIVFEQAENRMWAQMGVLLFLMSKHKEIQIKRIGQIPPSYETTAGEGGELV